MPAPQNLDVFIDRLAASTKSSQAHRSPSPARHELRPGRLTLPPTAAVGAAQRFKAWSLSVSGRAAGSAAGDLARALLAQRTRVPRPRCGRAATPSRLRRRPLAGTHSYG